MTSMDLVALTLAKMGNDHGDRQQECGKTGQQPLLEWPDIVQAIRAALPDVPEAVITDVGAALGRWSSTMYQLGMARAEGRETYDDGRRVGAAEERARVAKEGWLMPLLAACAEQGETAGTPEFLNIEPGELTPGDHAWLDQQVRAVLDAAEQFGDDAAVRLAVERVGQAPSAELAVALAETLRRDHRITLPGAV